MTPLLYDVTTGRHVARRRYRVARDADMCAYVRGDPLIFLMHSSTNFQAPPNAVDFLLSCDKVDHKQKVGFLLYLPGQLVT